MNVAERVRTKALRMAKGDPFTSSKFLGLGSRAAVDQALSRLVREGSITRVRRGVFVRPAHNRHVGEVPPESFAVAKAIAESHHAEIDITSAEAARRFEFSTQVPTRPIYLTSGPSGRFRLGNLEVELKHVCKRKLALAGSPAGHALLALWELGAKRISPQAIESVRNKLGTKEYAKLISRAEVMPAWMRAAIQQHDRAPAA